MDADQPPDLRFADLTAAELWLLRYTTVARPGPETLKLGLQELVLGGALRIVPVRARRRRQPMLVAGPRFDAPVAPALAPLVALHAGARRRPGATADGEECEGILIDAFAKAAKRAFRGAHGYGEHEVAGVLEDRGLLEVRRRAGGRPHFTRTAAGDGVDVQLDEWLRGAQRDATSAQLRKGGAAGLLMHHIHPELGALERLVKPPIPPPRSTRASASSDGMSRASPTGSPVRRSLRGPRLDRRRLPGRGRRRRRRGRRGRRRRGRRWRRRRMTRPRLP